MLVILETDRLLVRQWDLDDGEAVFAILGDPEVTRYLGHSGSEFADLVRSQQWLQRIQRAYPKWNELGSWAVVEKSTGDILGGGGLLELEDGPDVEVFYHFRRASWGFGYATEFARGLIAYAWETTDLPRLIGLTYTANTASQCVLTKAGMTHSGQRHAYGADLEYFTIERPSPAG